jgi:hypothetical protein
MVSLSGGKGLFEKNTLKAAISFADVLCNQISMQQDKKITRDIVLLLSSKCVLICCQHKLKKGNKEEK